MSASDPNPESDPSSNDPDGQPAAPGRFSLHGLSAAFARLTGAGKPADAESKVAQSLDELQEEQPTAARTTEVLSPRMIIEGMLFVGDGEGRSLTNRQIASHIRDVSPNEVDALIEELNQSYCETGATYEIVGEGAGYQMRVRPEYESVRQRFYGRVREAKLTPQAIEVLSVVAYRQPVTADQIKEIRGSRSKAILSQLVRRGLLSLVKAEDPGGKNTYHTTDRFNRLFRIASPQDLPNSEDLDDS